jgi:hypothetical protein
MMSASLLILRRADDALGDGVRAFERGDDAFQPREFHERFERLVVGGVGVFHAFRSCNHACSGPTAA